MNELDIEIRDGTAFDKFCHYFKEYFKNLICVQNNLYIRQESSNSTFSLDFSLYCNFTAASLSGLFCSRRF